MLTRVLRPHADEVYALLRIMTGLMFTFHGLQKIFGILAESQPPVFSQLWIGGIIELVCGPAVALGAFTTVAAFLASGTMAVAYTQFHWKLAFDGQFFPVVNHGELALVYAFLMLFIAQGDTPTGPARTRERVTWEVFAGPGRYSHEGQRAHGRG